MRTGTPSCTVARLFATLLLFPTGSVAQAAQQSSGYRTQDLCVSRYLASVRSGPAALGIAESDAVRLTHQILERLGSPNQPSILPCGEVEQAQAYVIEDAKSWPDDQVSIQPGEYILYNPTWTRQVIGSDRSQAIVLFGHEVGHIINRDYTGARKYLSVYQREKEADFVAGCVAARDGVKLTDVVNLLTRLRGDRDGEYPSRSVSIKSATSGYRGCLGSVPPKPAPVSPSGIARGYIYYEELQGAITEAGVFRALNLTANPPYRNVAAGTILRAARTARFRVGPSSLSDLTVPAKVEAGECVKTLKAAANPVAVTKASSGGHLEVELLSSCP